MQATLRNSLPWQDAANAGRVPLVIVRHGQTAWNKERRFLGRTDLGLDADGLAQAERVGRYLADLAIREVVSSPLSRAWQTADAIAARHPDLPSKEGQRTPVRHVPDLIELAQGELEGKPGADLPRLFPTFFQEWLTDPTDARVPGGETLRECQSRGMAALDALVEGCDPGPPIVATCHKMLISSMFCAVLGLPLRAYSLISQRNTALNLLSHGADGWQLHTLDQTPHLDTTPG